MNTGIHQEIGSRIRERRVESGLSQEAFARLAGIDRAFYGKIERGARNTSLEMLERIAIALKADLGELFAGLPKPDGNTGP